MKILFVSALAGFLAIASISGSDSYAGTTTVVSVDSAGKLGNNHSYEPAISGDGRYVAFWSSASNLVPGDTNGMPDIFVHDRQTGTTTLISKNNAGKLGNSDSSLPAISADGRYVAFQSRADNLVLDDTNERLDVFVHDRQTGETTLISKNSAGNPGNNDSYLPTISADGRYVAFYSFGNNLTPGDTNGKADIFIYDRQTGTTTLISKNSAGNAGNGDSSEPAVSGNGRYVAFRSFADNLVPGDTNGKTDIFVHDRQTGKTSIISKNNAGNPGNGDSSEPAVSGDGRYVAFWSFADNLVPEDTNGQSDIFIHDRQTGETKIITKSSAGQLGDNDSNQPSISDDGRHVAFASKAGNLVPGDANNRADAFVYDSKTGEIKIASKNSIGKPGNGGGCIVPAINANGRYVAFESEAEDLVSGDTNNKSDVFVHDLR